MTVKELMDELKYFDNNDEVVIKINNKEIYLFDVDGKLPGEVFLKVNNFNIKEIKNE